jgi:hypothetical protein
MTEENKYFKLYDDAIALNKSFRQGIPTHQLSLFQYMHEFGMVKLNLGRRTFKTTYIDENSDVLNDIIICQHAYKPFHSRYYYIGSDNINDFRGFTLEENATIWIDDYSSFSPQDIRHLHEILCYIYRNVNQTVICLG